MIDRIALWALRLLWLSLPYSAGALFVDAIDGRSSGFAGVTVAALWVAWALGLVAALVPHTVSLTYLRIVAPAGVAAAAWAMTAESEAAVELMALVVTGVISVLALSAPLGARFMNGTAYGDEVRLPLRPPRSLLMGPIPLAWAIAAAGAVAGPLLLGAKQWVAGGLATAVGVPAAALAARALHGLSRRWLVFVPAGMVIHDLTALADPQLFRRVDIAHLGPALADSAATDLTLDAPGLAIELTLHGTMKVVRRPMRRAEVEDSVEAQSLLVTPSRPGVVLREAERHRITVG